MTKEQTSYLIESLVKKGVVFDEGLTDGEVAKIESTFKINFSPDLKSFLQDALPVSESFVNWRLGLKSKAEADKIFSNIDWPLAGMLFDIESNDFWVDAWGVRPDNYTEQAQVAEKHYHTYPKLIPIFSHRYIPGQPNESGNPVFSVHQMDIIYYGFDLATYFANEFEFELTDVFKIFDKPNRTIAFWSDFA